MKTIITSICIAAVLMACGGKQGNEGKKEHDTVFKPDSPTVAVVPEKTILTAHGNEPFWSLSIGEKIIKFKLADKDTVTASDYKINTNADGSTSYIGGKDFGITVTDKATKDGMNNLTYAKSVSISFQGKKYSGAGGDVVADMAKPTTKENDKITNVDKSKTERITVNGKWVLNSLTGLKGALSQFTKGMPNIDLNPTANSISGFGGCNNLNGSLTIFDGKKIKIEKLGSTKMLCTGIPEAAFLTALRTADSFAVVNGKLQLKAAGAVVGTFTRPTE